MLPPSGRLVVCTHLHLIIILVEEEKHRRCARRVFEYRVVTGHMQLSHNANMQGHEQAFVHADMDNNYV